MMPTYLIGGLCAALLALGVLFDAYKHGDVPASTGAFICLMLAACLITLAVAL